VLTEAGRIALDYADTIFEAGAALAATLGDRPGAAQRVLRVGALPTLSRNFQLEFVAPLVGRRDVELVLRSGTLRDLLAQLEAHEIDVILATAPAQPDTRLALVSHRLDEQPVSLVGPPRFAGGDRRFPAALHDAPVLLPGRDSAIRTGFDRWLAAAGVTPLILAEVDDMAMLRLLARDSDALTLVPPIVVRDELAAGSLVEVERLAGLSETFYAIVQRRRFPNPLLAGLLETRRGVT
jgi:LysR family transcriptional regulator, transcriptional activator of nhaA